MICIHSTSDLLIWIIIDQPEKVYLICEFFISYNVVDTHGLIKSWSYCLRVKVVYTFKLLSKP